MWDFIKKNAVVRLIIGAIVFYLLIQVVNIILLMNCEWYRNLIKVRTWNSRAHEMENDSLFNFNTEGLPHSPALKGDSIK